MAVALSWLSAMNGYRIGHAAARAAFGGVGRRKVLRR